MQRLVLCPRIYSKEIENEIFPSARQGVLMELCERIHLFADTALHGLNVEVSIFQKGTQTSVLHIETNAARLAEFVVTLLVEFAVFVFVFQSVKQDSEGIIEYG